MVFLCILHCCMAGGGLQVAFVEDLPKESAEALQRALHQARTGVKLVAWATPDKEEACALFVAWEEIGPMLDYIMEDGELQAIVAMCDLLRDLYTDKPPLEPTGGRGGARLPHILLQGGVPTQLPRVLGGGCHRGRGQRAAFGVGLGAVCADVVERLNALLKRTYNDHMPRAMQGEREAEVVLQVWAWWFLKFHIPLCNYGTPHTAPCTMAKLTATCSPPLSTLASPPPSLCSPCHGLIGNEANVGRYAQRKQASPGVFCMCPPACVFRLIFVLLSLIFVD